jgi:hypothetical protein
VEEPVLTDNAHLVLPDSAVLIIFEEQYELRKLHDEELHGLYSSPSIIRVIKARRLRWEVNVARMGEVRGGYDILVERPEERRPLGRPRRRWENNIKMDLKVIGFGMWIGFIGLRIGTGGGLL